MFVRRAEFDTALSAEDDELWRGAPLQVYRCAFCDHVNHHHVPDHGKMDEYFAK